MRPSPHWRRSLGFMRKGNKAVRIIWGILLIASLYALVTCQWPYRNRGVYRQPGNILAAEKAKRFVYFLVGVAVAILLGLRGFYSQFFLYFTRTGHVDITMTGRTVIWEEGWTLLWKSPWVGFGFQADRFYLGGLHMHNAFLHAWFSPVCWEGGRLSCCGNRVVPHNLLLFSAPARRQIIDPCQKFPRFFSLRPFPPLRNRPLLIIPPHGCLALRLLPMLWRCIGA